jgi:hypothetical protein
LPVDGIAHGSNEAGTADDTAQDMLVGPGLINASKEATDMSPGSTLASFAGGPDQDREKV